MSCPALCRGWLLGFLLWSCLSSAMSCTVWMSPVCPPVTLRGSLQSGALRLEVSTLEVTHPGSNQAWSCLVVSAALRWPPSATPPTSAETEKGRSTLAGQPWAHWVCLSPQGPPGSPAPMMDESGDVFIQGGCQGQGPGRVFSGFCAPPPSLSPGGHAVTDCLGLPAPPSS